MKRHAARYGLFCLFILIAACTRKSPDSIRLITLKSENKTGLITYKVMEAVYGADSTSCSTFPVEDGDLIISDDLFLFAEKDLPDTLTLRQEKFLYYLNGELYQIRIDTNQEFLPWFHQQEGKHYSHVRNLWFNIPLQESHKPFLQQLAGMNPHLSVTLNYDAALISDSDLIWIAQFIKPRVLIMSEGARDMEGLSRANFHELEYLVIGQGPADILPALPSLKSLFVTCDGPLPAPSFFEQNLQLEKLTVIGGKPASAVPAPWKKLNRLKELNYVVDSIPAYDIARHHPDLKTLVVQKGYNIDSIKGLRNLKWLSLASPSAPSLDQLSSALTSVELLSLFNTDTTQNFSALGKLKNLKYLVISNEVGLDTTLYAFKALTYLSVPEKFYNDSTRVNALRRALPGTMISPNAGVCMGSGWLLLVLPLAFLFFLAPRHQPFKGFRSNGL